MEWQKPDYNLPDEFDRQLIGRLQDNLIDCDLEVDNRRHDLVQAVDHLCDAVRRRADVAGQLAALLKDVTA